MIGPVVWCSLTGFALQHPPYSAFPDAQRDCRSMSWPGIRHFSRRGPNLKEKVDLGPEWGYKFQHRAERGGGVSISSAQFGLD